MTFVNSVSHIPYVISIIFIRNNNIVETFVFYLIFIMNNYNIKYKNKIITKLLIYLNCYKNNYDFFKLFLLTLIVSEKYEKGFAIASSFYYFYSSLMLSVDSYSFYKKVFITYMIVGSNIRIRIVYNMHFRMFMESDISLQNYMSSIDFIKNIFICLFLAL